MLLKSLGWYLTAGSIIGLAMVIFLYFASKKLERTPIKDDDELEKRNTIIDEWDNIVKMTGSYEKAIFVAWIACTLVWPLIPFSYLKTKKDFKKKK